MKKIIPLFIFLTLSIVLFAQETVNISQGESYNNNVYVSMADGEVNTINSSDWDIALDVSSPFAIAIRINDGHNVNLKTYPETDLSGWSSIDSTGYSSWPSLNNQLDSWENGAFNISADGSMSDFSWGYYTGDPDHDVVGDSIYLITTSTGLLKQLRIDFLDGGDWQFTHSNIDGTEEVTESLSSSDYPERNFIYFDLDTSTPQNLEPANSEWDLVFTKYYGQTAFGLGATAGIFSNRGVEIIQADDVDVSSVVYTDYSWISDQENISVIGNDWKNLNDMFIWEIVADRCYFVKNQSGDIYKLIFTSFSGSSAGDLSYTTELISGSSIGVFSENDWSVYPNPTQGDVVQIQSKLGSIDSISLTNSFGQQLVSEQFWINQGETSGTLNLASLPNGVYHLTAWVNNSRVTKTIIKN